MRSLWHLAVLATCLQAVAPACPQIVLPRAVNQAPLGSTVAPPAGSDAPRRAEAPVVRAAGEEAVIGRQFQQNGNAGVMAFSRSKTLEVDKLVLIGEQISRPSEACRVEIAGARISLKAAGMHDGLLSYDMGLEACPFSIDILESAVLARGGTCEMTAADC